MPAKYQVEITRTAETDIVEVWLYISGDSIEDASRFVTQLEKKISMLERLPYRCPSIPENKLLGTEYRHLIIGDYRVIFRIAQLKVFVLRIIHGNRLLDDSLFAQR